MLPISQLTLRLEARPSRSVRGSGNGGCCWPKDLGSVVTSIDSGQFQDPRPLPRRHMPASSYEAAVDALSAMVLSNPHARFSA